MNRPDKNQVLTQGATHENMWQNRHDVRVTTLSDSILPELNAQLTIHTRGGVRAHSVVQHGGAQPSRPPHDGFDMPFHVSLLDSVSTYF